MARGTYCNPIDPFQLVRIHYLDAYVAACMRRSLCMCRSSGHNTCGLMHTLISPSASFCVTLCIAEPSQCGNHLHTRSRRGEARREARMREMGNSGKPAFRCIIHGTRPNHRHVPPHPSRPAWSRKAGSSILLGGVATWSQWRRIGQAQEKRV